MAEELLRMDHLTIRYRPDLAPAVTDFNLVVRRGEIVSIVGESGSGKSTATKALLGILPHGAVVEGDIYLQGREVLKFSPEEWDKLHGREIGYVFQNSGDGFNPLRKIGDVFCEYIRVHEKMSKQQAWEKAEDMLTRMNLPRANRIMNSYAAEMSGGMLQRINIAMAMTFMPPLLVADEPVSALDGTTQARIVREMMDLRNKYGATIVMISHNMGVSAYMSDYIVVMQHGKIVEQGTTQEILENPQQQYTKDLLAAVPRWESR